MSFYIDSWYECFSTKFTTKGFIPKWTANICLSTMIVDMNVFPQNSQLKALFLNERLWYVFYIDSWYECFSKKFKSKGFITKSRVLICLSTLIVDMQVFPQNSQLKALFLNEWLWYVFLQW